MKLKVSLVFLAAVGCLVYIQQTQKRQIADSYDSTSKISILANQSLPEKPLAVASRVAPSTAEKTTQSSLKRFVEREASHLYDTDEDTPDVEGRLRERASALNTDDINELARIATNKHGIQDERTLAVYLLTLKGPEAQESLLKVFLSPLQDFEQPAPAHSVEELQRQQEYALRTMALEGIEANLQRTSYRKPLGPAVKSDSSYLNGLLKIVKLGEKMRRPMLKKFIDQNLDQETL